MSPFICVCPRCGGRTLVDREENALRKVSPTALAIVPVRVVRLCTRCGYRGA
jgi:hypothetical protein